jgi:hypothetical protein
MSPHAKHPTGAPAVISYCPNGDCPAANVPTALGVALAWAGGVGWKRDSGSRGVWGSMWLHLSDRGEACAVETVMSHYATAKP